MLCSRRGRRLTVEPNEIFQLIIKADELLKYATDERGPRRREQARELLERARAEATAARNDALVAQAAQRLADVAELEGP